MIATSMKISDRLTETARWPLRLVRVPFGALPVFGASIQWFE